jgi:DNA-binding HxlR family transcriptional regulator
MGTGLLAARLKHLEREGLAGKITLPAPARTPAYALTEAGAKLGPAVLTEGRTNLAELIKNGSVAVSGDKQAPRWLRTLFRRPRPATR